MILSLIDKDFVSIGTFYGKGPQASVFYDVDLPAKYALKRADYTADGKQGDAATFRVLYEYVNIAVFPVVSSRA